MNPQSSILIIIVTWNKQEYVCNLLKSLESINYNKDCIDIVVIDNASEDDTVETLKKEFPYITIIENSENLGGTGGFNTGLAYANNECKGKYTYLWLLDNDVIVHPNVLQELVAILENEDDIAIAGSTMMQMTKPWRVNEMGAFVDLGRGSLLLNRHKKDIQQFKGLSIQQLQEIEIDLSLHLEKCKPYIDVDYVAAASLLIKAEIAQESGLWCDFFIHFDDVEWCLRVAKMGKRVVVSARSIIWHMPADEKVPTWVLYYDNRNVLSMLKDHSSPDALKGTKKYIAKKSIFYCLLGKNDLANLHIKALEDFDNNRFGKSDISLEKCYFQHQKISEILNDPEIKSVLIPWTVDLLSSELQEILVKVMKKRSDLKVDYMSPPPVMEDELQRQLPMAGNIAVPMRKIQRLFFYLRMRNRYDLVFQSDYRPLLLLNLMSDQIIYVNAENVSLRRRPSISDIAKFSFHCFNYLK